MKHIWRWHQGECVEHCSVSRFLQSHPKGKTGLSFSRQHETECYRLGDWANIGCGICGTPSTQEWCGAYDDVVVTELVQCGNSPECTASPGLLTKLVLNCRHWDKSLHSYPPIISVQGPRGNPLFEYHQSPNPMCERLPGFPSCKRYWHNAFALTARGPDPNVIVNVSLYNETEIKEI